MKKSFSSMVVLGTAGYLLYRNRYRVMNSVLGTGWVRKAAVSTFMGMPGMRDKVMNTVFGGPNRF
ncbi:hypothetical protein A8F94_04415 [Bacillus sp. FJAT-27225]|uniref:hypothetical protein n=1 Tax=Bacillus sp. FJAT-27225 TaxID=1743144 RepID=UPI00080C20BD|nr:hypothetical protein [Bacillus sp. FJAT-27225]OCA91109.1 hypothetical protein A8F94_04415 [Bacillus sp. FJAT-27225]